MTYYFYRNGRKLNCDWVFPDGMPEFIREWALEQMVSRITEKGFVIRLEGDKFLVETYESRAK